MMRQPTSRRPLQPRPWTTPRWLSLVIMLALLPIFPVAPAPVASAMLKEAITIPGEVLVTLADTAAPAQSLAELPAGLQPLLQQYGIVEMTAIAGMHTYRLRSSQIGDAALLASAFAASDLVVGAEPNRLFQLTQVPPTNDPLYQGGNQWHLAAVRAADAWAITTGSSEILVAVVDTGIDPDQADLAGKVIGGYDFVNEREAIYDDIGHGTAVASFITARTNDGKGLAGMAPDVRLLAYKAFFSGGGTGFDIARSIVAASNAGARVINGSFGGFGQVRIIDLAIAYAVSKGSVVVVSAGNGGTARVSHPAANPLAIAVGATNRQDQVVEFSQWGPHVSVAAPGSGVLGAVPDGDQEVINGTSFSAPIVSGVVALMLSINPSLTPGEVKRILEGTADDIGPAGFDERGGWGRVNAGRAVAAARDRQTQPNRAGVIQGQVTGADPTKVLISVDPLAEVGRPAADGSYRLPYRGRTTYTLRATVAGTGQSIGPITVTSSGQPGDVQTVNLAFGQ